jgi:trans-aconitate methyltransferase
MIAKPYSQACENNKQPILQIISQVYTQATTVWEIGSGTGQHACYFAQQLPYLQWQPTDRFENIDGISLWIKDAQLANLKTPLTLSVQDETWPCSSIDALFTANTIHIMSWDEVQLLFARLKIYLAANASLCIYGPFNYHGTSPVLVMPVLTSG